MFHSKLSLRAALTAALVTGATLLAGPVKAADLDPALEDPSQIYGSLPTSNVVFGSGWYARGDVGVTNTFATRITSASALGYSSSLGTANRPSYNFSLGGGYSFTNHFRADIIADFFQPAESKLFGLPCPDGSGTNCILNSTFNRYDALANGYFDIGTWSIVTPYIGAGVGVGFGNLKGDVDGTKTGFYQAYNGYQNFAFAGMAGVALDVYPHVKVDLGYRYVNSGRVAGVEIYNNELRAGLRYMIDN